MCHKESEKEPKYAVKEQHSIEIFLLFQFHLLFFVSILVLFVCELKKRSKTKRNELDKNGLGK
jgi:hypothetical protein